jgi:hypothetical protein
MADRNGLFAWFLHAPIGQMPRRRAGSLINARRQHKRCPRKGKWHQKSVTHRFLNKRSAVMMKSHIPDKNFYSKSHLRGES